MVTVVTSGDYGKPRPALIVQADAYAEHPSITVLPLTSELHDVPLLRVTVEPGGETGLRRRSQVMVDKATTIPRAKAEAKSAGWTKPRWRTWGGPWRFSSELDSRRDVA